MSRRDFTTRRLIDVPPNPDGFYAEFVTIAVPGNDVRIFVALHGVSEDEKHPGLTIELESADALQAVVNAMKSWSALRAWRGLRASPEKASPPLQSAQSPQSSMAERVASL